MALAVPVVATHAKSMKRKGVKLALVIVVALVHHVVSTMQEHVLGHRAAKLNCSFEYNAKPM